VKIGRLSGGANRSCEQSRANVISRIERSLILHECGHLVLHWEALVERAAGGILSGELANATSQEEREAWIFCSALLGRVVEDIVAVAKGKANKRNDYTADYVW